MELFTIMLLLITVFLLLTVIGNVLFWPKIILQQSTVHGTVSVLIPARNEAINIEECITCLQPENRILEIKEILVYDDHSVDETAAIVARMAQQDLRIRLLPPVDLPEGWMGKNFACSRLAASATGDWLLFLDADARIAEGAIPGMLTAAERHAASFLSCWPGLRMHGFWEKLLMPMLNFFVFSVFPAPISFQRNMPSLGIAHGACIMIRRGRYEKIGGHARVRDQIFEDTQLARLWRMEGERSLCFDGQNAVWVRMYGSFDEIWRGFQKNFYPGFESPVSFWLFLLTHTLIFLMPFLLFPWSDNLLLVGLLVLVMRMLLAIRFHHPLWSAVLHPVAECFLLALALSSWWQCRSGKGVHWKGRTYLART